MNSSESASSLTRSKSDDSTAGTRGAVRQIGRSGPRVRLIHRIGRRGLSSACIVGALAGAAGAVVGAVWNFALGGVATWRKAN